MQLRYRYLCYRQQYTFPHPFNIFHLHWTYFPSIPLHSLVLISYHLHWYCIPYFLHLFKKPEPLSYSHLRLDHYFHTLLQPLRKWWLILFHSLKTAIQIHPKFSTRLDVKLGRNAGWRSPKPHSSPLDTPAGTHWSVSSWDAYRPIRTVRSRVARDGWNVAALIKAGGGRCGQAFHRGPPKDMKILNIPFL